jgi:hypothetical protein
MWLIAARPDRVTLDAVATAIALLMLQQRSPFLWPTLTAPREMPATAFIDDAGRWIDHRRLRYPEAFYSEVATLAATVREHHADLLAQTLDASCGRRPSGWAAVDEVAEENANRWETGNQSWTLGLTDPDNVTFFVPSLPELPSGVDATPALTDALVGALIAHDYSVLPYLQHAESHELEERAEDAMRNLYELRAAGSWSVDFHDFVQGRAIARILEVISEIRRRVPSQEAAFVQRLAPYLRVGNTDEWQRSFRWFDRAGHAEAGHARFGRREHLERMFHEGRIRLGPASSYADSSLGEAKHDVEGRVVQEIDVTQASFSLVDEKDASRSTPLEVLRASTHRNAPHDAYILCCAQRISPRLFHDFDANACIVIHDTHAFAERMAQATLQALPGWQLHHFGVEYYDPYSPRAAIAEPYYFKHFRYAYQHEYRYLWLPPTAIARLEPRFVHLGSLADIAELIHLE